MVLHKILNTHSKKFNANVLTLTLTVRYSKSCDTKNVKVVTLTVTCKLKHV